MRECGTEYMSNVGVENVGICCGSTGKMRELGNQQEIKPHSHPM